MEQYRALGNLEIIDDAQEYLNGLKKKELVLENNKRLILIMLLLV